MEYILLLLGFLLLIKGADYFVDGSSSVAKIMHIPTIIIGLTVVAFGTSMPEMSVSVTAALQGANALAVGNVVGSNIFNVLVVLGVSALIVPVVASESVMRKEFPFSIAVAGILFLLMGGYRVASLASEESVYTLSRLAGCILLVLFLIFLMSAVMDALKARSVYSASEDVAESDEVRVLSPLKSFVFIVVGIIGIAVGGNLVVDSASIIGATFGMSESFIGLTIVALGTSLPELVTSVVAAKKGENDLAIGNVVGSNIFNILLILGVSATISPITVSVISMYDIFISMVASILVFVSAKTKGKITKVEGGIFLMAYAAFFVYILFR